MTGGAARRTGTIGGLDLLLQALLIFNTLLMLYPIVFMAFSAFKSTGEIYDAPFAFPNFSNLANFQTILTETNILTYFFNSLIVTSGAVALTLILGTMASYALARYDFPGATLLFIFFLCGLMVPLKLAIIPLFIELRDLNLIDTRLGLVCVYAAMGLPSAVFILTGFLRTVPREFEEAARIDGASEAGILWRIMLPLIRPALAIAGLHNAVPIWNDFFFPLVLVQTDSRKTLPQGLTAFMGEFTTDWGALFAGLTLAALPITLVYVALSRSFVRGLTSGAIR